jgi:hypothetical protein
MLLRLLLVPLQTSVLEGIQKKCERATKDRYTRASSGQRSIRDAKLDVPVENGRRVRVDSEAAITGLILPQKVANERGGWIFAKKDVGKIQPCHKLQKARGGILGV